MCSGAPSARPTPLAGQRRRGSRDDASTRAREPARPDLAALAPLQRALLDAALGSVCAGGVVAYVTCSPHHAETVEVVADAIARSPRRVRVLPAAEALPEVPDAALGDFVQLWPHRHDTDAMFLALLSVD